MPHGPPHKFGVRVANQDPAAMYAAFLQGDLGALTAEQWFMALHPEGTPPGYRLAGWVDPSDPDRGMFAPTAPGVEGSIPQWEVDPDAEETFDFNEFLAGFPSINMPSPPDPPGIPSKTATLLTRDSVSVPDRGRRRTILTKRREGKVTGPVSRPSLKSPSVQNKGTASNV